MGSGRPKTILLLTQVYVPDPASVGQHMADAAAELVRRGHRVIVFTSRRGFEDPRQIYPRREILEGVEVCRLPLGSFGKRTIMLRVLGGLAFLLQGIVRALLLPRIDALLITTSPPMASLAGLVIAAVRRVPLVYWLMDLNPDQVVVSGRLPANSMLVRLLGWLNRRILKRAGRVVVLDRFMQQRVLRRAPVEGTTVVMPPWPLCSLHQVIEHASNPFRSAHELQGKFVVMYSGNLSPVHPLQTILEAALRLRDCERLVFVFIGSGLARREIEDFVQRHELRNVRLLPYQPLSELAYSLSAADVHLVSMGNEMVGIVHPCKIYGAMACGRPILLLGPKASHVGELLETHRVGWQVDHDDVDTAVQILQQAIATSSTELAEMGQRGRQAVETGLSREILRARFCDQVEAVMSGSPTVPATDGAGNSAQAAGS